MTEEINEKEQEIQNSEAEQNREPDQMRQPDQNRQADQTRQPEQNRKPGQGHRFGLCVLGIAAALLVLAGVTLSRFRMIRIPLPGGADITVLLSERSADESEGTSLSYSAVLKKLVEIDGWLERDYYYTLSGESMTDGLFDGMLESLTDEDAYARYYSREETEALRTNISGNYLGIGAVVTKLEESGEILIYQVLPGSPAEEAGLLAGDILLSADGTDVSGMDLTTLTDTYIKGEEGSVVELTVRRGEEELTVSCTRGQVELISVTHAMLSDEAGSDEPIGYLWIRSFEQSTEAQFKTAVEELLTEGAKGLIIDLRDNSGGDMNVSLRMLDYLLRDDLEESGTLLLSVHGKDGEEERHLASDGHAVDVPIVLIVNANTASSSEIFAGTLQVYGSRVVGTKTYGKGIVQDVITLSDGSAIRYTAAEYVLPDGSRPHGVGLTPDIETEATEEMLEKGLDPEKPDTALDVQLREAVVLLSEAGAEKAGKIQ